MINKPDLSKMSDIQRSNYLHTLKDYVRVSDAIKEMCNSDNDDENIAEDLGYLFNMQYKLMRTLEALELTPEEKLQAYLDGRADELPPDGNGKDEICGKLLPTEMEVKIGMYPARDLYYYRPFTCGVYHFYTTDGKFNYVGGSQYIEYALHSHFCRWRSEANNPNKERIRKFKGLGPVKYILDNYQDKLRFRIIEKVPYSLLDVAVRNQRANNKAMWQYDITTASSKFKHEDYEAGKYNY